MFYKGRILARLGRKSPFPASSLLSARSDTSNARPSTLNPQPSTLNPQPSTLEPSTLDPQPSTLSPQPSALNPQPSTLNPQPSTLNPHPCKVVDLVGVKAVSGERSLTRQLALLDEELAALLASQVSSLFLASLELSDTKVYAR